MKGVHIERGNSGSRNIFIDLQNTVELNHRKYRSIPILSVNVYKKLNLLEGSEIELYRFWRYIASDQGR